MVLTQVPLQHVRPDPHGLAQAPQLLGSVCRSTQLPLQQVSLLAHTVPPHVHWPPVHISAGGQTLPHVPQLVTSVWRSTHCWLQHAFGAEHGWPAHPH